MNLFRQQISAKKKSVLIAESGLLSKNDPNPVSVINRTGQSRIVITCEHAGNKIPNRLGMLKLAHGDLKRHIAYDIGAAATAQRLAGILDAPLVLQHYSRLVIDCNRPKDTDETIPLVSDGTPIPGNKYISIAEREIRYQEIHRPFHQTVETLLDDRVGRNEDPILIAFHSFTPALETNLILRPQDLGLLYNRDDRLVRLFSNALSKIDHDFKVAHNQPYSVCDETDYTLPVHGEKRGIHHLLLEVRNDHLDNEASIVLWSKFLSIVLRKVEQQI